MDKYVKKPVVIHAMQWDGSEVDAMHIRTQVDPSGKTFRFVPHTPATRKHAATPPKIEIDTLEGTMAAVAGDWIIRGVQNEHYPCKPDIFELTYQKVEND